MKKIFLGGTFFFVHVLFFFCMVNITNAETVVTPEKKYVEGEILVQFKKDNPSLEKLETLHNIDSFQQINTPELQTIQAENGLPLSADIDRTYTATIEKGENTIDIIDSLEKDPRVEMVEPNFLYHITEEPSDTYFSYQWSLYNTDGFSGVVDADIDADLAWNKQTGSSSVVVAVIDTGIDYTHPDIAQNMWVNPGEIADDGIDNDENGFVDDVYGWDFFNNDNDPMDDQGHGTHVAGTIGAVGNNGIGVSGVSWNTQLAALKVCGTQYCSSSAILSAIAYAAAMGIPISNNSYGGGGYSVILESAINTAGAQANHLFVAAAGNNASNNDNFPFYPASYTSNYIISVASTTRYDQLSSFSNYGATSVDIAAPGSAILSTTPSGNYGYKSGTSMASPHIAGIAALLLSEKSTLTPIEIKNAIIQSGDELNVLNGKTAYGSRANAFSALAAIADEEPTPPPNTPPTAVIQSTTTQGETGDTILFDASESYDADGDVLTFTWTINRNPIFALNTLPTLSNQFTVAGTYNITVTVSDSSAEDSATMSVVIRNAPRIADTPPQPSPPKSQYNLFIHSIEWVPKKYGYKLDWESTPRARVQVQLIRQKNTKKQILYRWQQKETHISSKKIGLYFRNHKKQLQKIQELRIQLVAIKPGDTGVRIQKTIEIPRAQLQQWKQQYQ